MFSQEAPKYFKKSINVVPIKPGTKYCEINDWRSINFEEVVDKYPKHGLGLDLSSVDVVVIDIDTLDKEAQKEISEFLKDYPTPVMRQGNPNKLPSRFYQKSWQTQKIPGDVVELLCADKGQMIQVVIPPTLHPDIKGASFKWVGTSLVDFDVSNLPVFPEDAWNKLKAICSKYSKKKDSGEDVGLTESDGTRCMHNSHMKINSMINAGLRSGDSVETVVKSILDFDEKYNDKVSYFLCPSRKEWRVKDRVANAYQTVIKAAQDLVKKGDIDSLASNTANEIILNQSIDLDTNKKSFKKLPKLEGLGKEIFDDIYNNSIIPRSQFSFAATINLISCAVSNKFMFKNTPMNLYQYMIAPSGFGKDFPYKRSIRILRKSGMENIIGPNSPTSETVVLRLLEESRKKCLFINEAESLLKRMANDRTNHGLKEFLTYIFELGGDMHSEKVTTSQNSKTGMEKIGKIFSPSLNILMASTDDGFSAHANSDTFNTGFGNRFLFFFEDRFKRQKLLKSKIPDVPDSVINGIKLLAGVERRADLPPGAIDLSGSDTEFYIPQLELDEEASEAYEKLHSDIQDQIEASIGTAFHGASTRKMLFIHKFTGLHHAMINPDSYLEKPISKKSIVWATKAIDAIFHNMVINLNENVSTTDYGKTVRDFLRFIKKRTVKGSGTTVKMICQRFRGQAPELRKKVLKDLEEQGEIFKKDALGYFTNDKINKK